MVDRAIKVAILEGDFAAICDLGFPLALSLQLQTNALKLSEALWTAKSSGSGFSVSLFWPSTKVSNMKSLKKKRRRRRNPRTTTKVDVATSTSTPVHLPQSSTTTASLDSLSPNSAHPVDIVAKSATPTPDAPVASLPATNELPVQSSSSENQSACSDSRHNADSDTETELEVDLLSCTEVAYEKREDTHGVAYCDASNMYQWTPVVGKRRRRTPLPDYMLRRFPPHRRQELQMISSDSESSDSDQPLDIPEKASVKFAVCDGKPGLQVRTRNTSNWTPIASRTRAKLNKE